MALPGHRAAAQHWLDLYRAAGNRVPRLRSLDPLQFPAALPDTWIVDQGDDGRFRFHLLGQNMIDWRGANAKGLSFEEIYPPERLAAVNSMAQRVITEPAVSHQQMLSRIRGRSLPIPVDRIALPLCNEAGHIRHLFGVTVITGQPDGGDKTEQVELQRDDWYPLAEAEIPSGDTATA